MARTHGKIPQMNFCFTKRIYQHIPHITRSLAHRETRLSNIPIRPVRLYSKTEKAMVKGPDTSSDILTPAASPAQSPWGKIRADSTQFGKAFRISHRQSGQKFHHGCYGEYAPASGVDACAARPFVFYKDFMILLLLLQKQHHFPHCTAAQAERIFSRSMPSSTASALSGMTFRRNPPFTDNMRGSFSSSVH